MRRTLKPWYKVSYTLYHHWEEGECCGEKIPAHTTWEIAEKYTESIRQANKWLRELPAAKMEIVNRPN